MQYVYPLFASWRRRVVSGSTSTLGLHGYSTNLPANVDLLERYRGLFALGRIKEDEEQIRVVMQLRKLHREIEGYAPPAVQARHLNATHTVTSSSSTGDSTPWWSADSDDPVVSQSETIRGLVRVRTHAEEIEALTTPKGLLVTGPPGSGKSFLIDLWFSTLPTPYKARKHYNELVLEIYRAVWEETRRRMAAMHASSAPAQDTVDDSGQKSWNKVIREQWRQLLKSGSLPIRWRRTPHASSFSLTRSPVEPSIAYVVAQRLILRHWLLVFDEIQLLDVSSATLLADVLSWFWRMGGIIVGSSNKVPDDLYKNGVQRERLEPFVEALKARCPVILMHSERDWRAVRGSGGKRSWYSFARRQEFEATLAEIKRGAQSSSDDIVVFGRAIRVPWSANGTCEFTFAQLCDESLGPADYITLASRYHTFIITSIPVLRLSAKNQARRFISLIDALYEARCRIICLAEAEPEQLFFPDAPSISAAAAGGPREDVDVMMAEAVAETQDVYRPNVSSYDAPNMAQERVPTQRLALDTLSIFSGKDEQFAFKRALSRLLEMTSESYARDEQWAPLPTDARKWETSTSGSAPPQRTGCATTGPTRPHSSDSTDFAEEASLDRTSTFPADRPPAPRLSADHIWGVREDWGERARDWGRGASIHADPSSKPNPTSSRRPSESPSESPSPFPRPSPATSRHFDGTTQSAGVNDTVPPDSSSKKRTGGSDGASLRR
ncbi:AFG1-like ATPase-domain-containing protein [Cerioporus squamosus]|nr:AFG1-like ATPase-domain-containing protein [Cerioporus squamosus]